MTFFSVKLTFGTFGFKKHYFKNHLTELFLKKKYELINSTVADSDMEGA